jgi:hypothetical protein
VNTVDYPTLQLDTNSEHGRLSNITIRHK